MYSPKHFEQTRRDELHRVITEYPLGVLVLRGPHGLDANHLPFYLDGAAGEYGRLIAHVARANPLWRETRDGDEALVIFRAANAYISPNWYPSKHESHRQVPTWNYQAVHAHGVIRIRDDARFVRDVVTRLTAANEAHAGANRPWQLTDSAPEFIDAMIAAIVGLEIDITKLIGKWKLSQNREERDRVNAAEELGRRGDHITSLAMLSVADGK
jgi:transcriptional regulator